MARIDHAAIAEQAAPQLGLITVPQLRGLGLSAKAEAALRATGYLRQVSGTVRAVASSPTTSRQRLLAATLHAGTDAVASHLAAAWVWGFDGIVPSAIELSVPAPPPQL